jgi:uncharacterized protein YdeI (YjbR/CyaY-like superfamily)
MAAGNAPLFFATGEALRDWLEANHATADELWLGIYKKGSRKTGVTLAEAQDVAMCFGWVDSMTRRVDEESYMLRFTPRRPRSNWTPGNVARAEELIAEGRMHDAGVRAFERRQAR